MQISRGESYEVKNIPTYSSLFFQLPAHKYEFEIKLVLLLKTIKYFYLLFENKNLKKYLQRFL